MSSPITETITRRFSCRTFSGEALAEKDRVNLAEAAVAMTSGPFGSRLRFALAAATPGDTAALKRLGTYGMIRGASAFILGAAEPRGMYLEDFGYAMERLILHATGLGLGTCWVGETPAPPVRPGCGSFPVRPAAGHAAAAGTGSAP